MIAGLVSYHDWVGVQIVEDTLEHVRIGNLFLSKINFDVFLFFIFWRIEFKKNLFITGLEMNDAKYNQRRLAVAKFMGELYNYRLVDSALVFKVRSTMHNAH